MGFQQDVHMVVEDAGDQMVCLTVLSGMLAPGVSVMATLRTTPGNGMTVGAPDSSLLNL